MEDSLEDFIKITRNTKEGRKKEKENKEVRKEALIALQKRKECETRAVKIVEFLIEGKLRPEVFLRCLKHIDQAYYQDVVEERAITKLCGYSLCGKQIPEMPKKQYFINTKNNKVYDVTDRKNYCSNFCYKASIHIKQQIDNGPLWLRKLEDCPKFNLLSSAVRGLPGEEVDQGIAKPVQDTAFTSISSFTEISLREMDEMEVKRSGRKVTKKFEKKPDIMQTLHESDEIAETNITANMDKPDIIQTLRESDEISETNNTANMDNASSSSADKTVISDKNNRDVNAKLNLPSSSSDVIVKNVQEINLNEKVSEKNKIKSNISSKASKSKKKSETPTDVLQNIKKYVHEWITLETYLFLYGETKVKELLNEKQLKEYFENLKIAESTAAQQRKYLEICRKLHLNQLAEDKFDRSVIDVKMKPVPDYKKLKVEGKVLNLKVRSYYSGVPYESDDKPSENGHEETEKDAAIKDDTSPEFMPLVDSYSQTAIRRKIYLNAINKAMTNLTPNLGIREHLTEDLHSLVKTFKLQAHNVVFAPAVRTLIALILLKMLSIRDHNLKLQLESKQSETFIKIMLNYFPNAQTFLPDLLESIEDISLFLQQYFSENENC